MGHLQRNSDTGHLLWHVAGGHLMSECCCDLYPDYTGDVAVSLLRQSGAVFTGTALYQATGTLYAPQWNLLIDGKWLRLGKDLVTTDWWVQYQDQAFWEQDGPPSEPYAIYKLAMTRNIATGCPSGVYDWWINRTPVLTYEITLSDPP